MSASGMMIVGGNRTTGTPRLNAFTSYTIPESIDFLKDPKMEKKNNINSRLDATMIILLTISISSTCFGR